jgi:hypothetical protein
MKIGIEGQRLFEKETRNGHGCLELIKNLQDLDHENEYFICKTR